jgi:hypothetical protein
MYRYALRSGRGGAPAVIRMLLSDPGNRLGLERASDAVKAEATALLLQDGKIATRANIMKRRLEQAIAGRRRQKPWFWWLSPYQVQLVSPVANVNETELSHDERKYTLVDSWPLLFHTK